ncbi:MAG: sialate O-acetylesterase [Verrucomicrobia bacterium]|nr:sialate O-acetylesterase [Verrucomicrobiota bacterium]
MPRFPLRLAAAAFLIACFCAGIVRAQIFSPLPAKEKFHLFLLAGQSNMAGRGLVAPEDRTPHPRALMLNQAGEWVPAIDPLHFDKPAAVGVGLGKSFAVRIAEANPGITVGLIPCAVGGSPIDSWQPGVFYPPTKSYPWDDALKRARLALKAGVLKGILWHQGESDSHEPLAAAYEPKLHDLIARFRLELDVPDVPFIAGQMGVFADAPWDDPRKQVDQAQRDLPTKVARTGFVSAAGLTHKGDMVHFDAASYREFGRRYAEAFFKLTGGGGR